MQVCNKRLVAAPVPIQANELTCRKTIRSPELPHDDLPIALYGQAIIWVEVISEGKEIQIELSIDLKTQGRRTRDISFDGNNAICTEKDSPVREGFDDVHISGCEDGLKAWVIASVWQQADHVPLLAIDERFGDRDDDPAIRLDGEPKDPSLRYLNFRSEARIDFSIGLQSDQRERPRGRARPGKQD